MYVRIKGENVQIYDWDGKNKPKFIIPKKHKIIFPEVSFVKDKRYKYYAYVLWNDLEGIRYVGITNNPRKRYLEHIRFAFNSKVGFEIHKSKWIRKCLLNGIEIKQCIVYLSKDINDIEKREKELISFLKEDGLKLVNISEGGKCGKKSKYTKNIVERMKKMRLKGYLYKKIAKKFGCLDSHVITLLRQHNKYKKTYKRFSKKDVEEMKRMRKEGYTYLRICKIFGCNEETISKLLRENGFDGYKTRFSTKEIQRMNLLRRSGEMWKNIAKQFNSSVGNIHGLLLRRGLYTKIKVKRICKFSSEDTQKIMKMRGEGIANKKIMEIFGCSKNYIYYLLKQK